MSGLYCNEWEAYPAAWLRNLYPAATVDERSIADVGADDVAGYERVHFFAGIGGWEYALDLAGWPAGRQVWTGSCPCQPFSAAGRKLGAADSRHLWPEFYRLIAECRPPTIFGEQVAGAAGRAWLSAVRADMEAIGYAVGAADLCAASVGAPHIRQRLYWVAYASGAAGERDARCVLAAQARVGGADRAINGNRPVGPWNGGEGVRLANALHADRWPIDVDRQDGRDGQDNGRAKAHGQFGARGEVQPWADAEYLPCADGRARPTQPGIRPLAHGVPARASKLRAYGNAIVPQLAAAFIQAFMEAEAENLH